VIFTILIEQPILEQRWCMGSNALFRLFETFRRLATVPARIRDDSQTAAQQPVEESHGKEDF
jgi:hypothetical protein